LGRFDFGGIRHHDGARARDRLAGWRQSRHHHGSAIGLTIADLDQAHAATSDNAKVMMPAVMRHFDARASGSLYQVFLGPDLHFDIVNENGSHRDFSWVLPRVVT